MANNKYYMNSFFNTILKSFWFSLVTLFILNVIIFIASISESHMIQQWTFNITQGTFLIDNTVYGFEFDKVETKGLLLLLFILGILLNFKFKQSTPINN